MSKHLVNRSPKFLWYRRCHFRSGLIPATSTWNHWFLENEYQETILRASECCWHKSHWYIFCLYIFSCDQAALWMVFSVRPSVCLSVRLSVCLSHLFDYVPIIVSSWNFHEILPMTKVTSMQKVKVRGQRSRSRRSTPNLTVSGL